MALEVYSTLSRQKAPFQTITPNEVKMYVCGVTVYDYTHIGHGRTFISFDIIRRWFEASGYKVTFVRNITDVDDKIIRRAAERKISCDDLTEEYGRYMQEDMMALGCLAPTVEPRATQFIPQMLDIIGKLEKNGLAYKTEGGDVAFAAVNGSGEFKDAPFKGLKVIAALYPSISNWMARDDSGIFYVHDLKGNKLGVGPHDSTTELAAKVSLSVLGVTEQNSTLVNCGLGSGAEEVKNRTLDAIHGFTGVPISGLAKLADAVPCHLLKYTDSELRSIIRSNPFYYMEEIPAGTYNGQDEDVATFGIKCLLCVSENMDDDLVYEITSILYENRDRLKDLHPALSYASQTGFMYEDLPIELHPGAERYYAEQGLLQEHSR